MAKGRPYHPRARTRRVRTTHEQRRHDPVLRRGRRRRRRVPSLLRRRGGLRVAAPLLRRRGHGRRPQGRRRRRHRRAALRRDRLAGARRRLDAAAAGCACRLVDGAAPGDVPPAFAYECGPADAEGGGKPGGGALCAVCLEDVRRGEAVRRLPACGHLFHRDCVDMWLHAHTTCPLCRCDLVPRAGAAKTATAAAPQSSRDVLPPV